MCISLPCPEHLASLSRRHRAGGGRGAACGTSAVAEDVTTHKWVVTWASHKPVRVEAEAAYIRQGDLWFETRMNMVRAFAAGTWSEVRMLKDGDK